MTSLPARVAQRPGSHVLTASRGDDGPAHASNLADTPGLNAGSVVYLDMEVRGTLSADHQAYVPG